MALPILASWKSYFSDSHEGLGSSYERIILNDLLLSLKRDYDVKSVIEAPIFGFTGISGLNSIALAQSGCNVTLVDHDPERMELVSKMLSELKSDIRTQTIINYKTLPFESNSFTMGWNFSALWFVEDLSDFLKELTRVTRKIVLICVPNQFGLGYKWQKANTNIPNHITFNENNIDPDKIKSIMQSINWNLIDEDYIDCPLWPDIGMSKEKFFGKFLSSLLPSQKEIKPKRSISILDYYRGTDPTFPDRMRKLSIFEEFAPEIFKKYWAHHKWLLFENNNL
jgi:hypothetical protein